MQYFPEINGLEGQELHGFTVYDLNGRVVLHLEKTGFALEIGGLNPDVYFVKLAFKQGEVVRKVVVE